MTENSSPLTSPESFHTEIVRLVESKSESVRDRGTSPSEVSPHPEGGRNFEKELADRMVTRVRQTTGGSSSGGVASYSSAVRTRSRGGGSMALLVILGVILVLAGYIAFFDNGGESADQTSDVSRADSRTEIPEPTRRSTGPINYFNVAIEGFDQLLAGRIQPEFEETRFGPLKEQLQGELDRPLSFSGASAGLIGGDITTVRELRVPRYFYRGEATTMIVVEVPWEDLVAENGVYVAEDIRGQLESGQTVYTPGPSNGTIALFRRGESAVIAVADRSEPDLVGILGL